MSGETPSRSSAPAVTQAARMLSGAIPGLTKVTHRREYPAT